MLHGTDPSPDGIYTAKDKKRIGTAQIQYLSQHEDLGEPEDLTNLIVGLTAAGDVASLLKGVGQIGARELGATAVKQAAGTAEANSLVRALSGAARRERPGGVLLRGGEETALHTAQNAGWLRRAFQGGVSRSVVRDAAKGAAKKAEPAAVRLARERAAGRAAQAAERLPGPVRAAGSVAGRVVTTPIKHPFTAPLAIQAPTALMHGDPKEFVKALEGTGTLADIGHAVGGAVSGAVPGKVAQNLIRDAFDLPAQALPSVYLPVAGAVEAAQGDPSRLHRLLDAYGQTGLLPAVFRGDPTAALHAIENHPLYSALEVSGATALVGRGSGALVRGATGGRLAGTARPDLAIEGYPNIREAGRRYSPDLIRQLAQRAHEAAQGHRGRDPFVVNERGAKGLLRQAVDRFVFEQEQLRRGHRADATKAVEAAKPKGGASADVVSLAVQRIIRHPETFDADLRAYRVQLEQAYKSGELTPSEAKANRALVGQIDKGIHSGNPEEVVKAANAFIQLHADAVHELVSRGLLTAEQAKKAAAIPFARTHLDASYKEGVGVVDRHGNSLSLHQITAEMQRHGVEPPGFLTHRPSTRGGGAFFRNFYPERQRLPNQRRTGESTARGTYDASYHALVEQAARSRSVADAATAFDEMVKRFGKQPPHSVQNMNDAWAVLRDPEHHGVHLPPGVDFVPFRTAPFLALRQEIDAAAKHQGLLDPQQEAMLEQLPSKAIAEAQRPGPGPVVLMPKLVVTRLEEHTQRLPTGLKAAQAVTGAFKSAILPTSPSWVFGNVLDVGIRSMLAAIGPFDVALGRKLATGKTMFGRQVGEPIPVGAQESIVTGSHFSSFEHVQTYRDARQFADSRLAPLARALGTVRRTPGPRQLVNAYIKYRDTVFAWNSRFFERLPQYGAIGKEARREVQAATGRWHHALMLGDGALEDLAKGLRHTDKQIQYAKAVEEVFGNWGKNGPEARRLLTSVAPFWLWARASTRFVLLTMPAHHPIATGLIAAAAEMTQQEREQFGLDKFGPEPLPAFLQGGLPVNGGVSPWAKYSSFGVFADYPNFLANVVLPQVSGPLQALQGLDWKGEQLVDSEGRPVSEPDKVRVALATQLEAMVPFLGLYQRVRSGGLDKAFNPAHAYPPGTVEYLRSLSDSKQITVPVGGNGSAGNSGPGGFTQGYLEQLGGVDYGEVFSGGGGSGIDYGKVFGGG
ncbi:MAG: hypothetical protein ACJ75S_04035 [Solirubrobacterales bacterium]